MENSSNSPRKKQKSKIGCCTKFITCICCCCFKKGKGLKWGIGSDLWNKISKKFQKKQSQPEIYTILLKLYSRKPSIEELRSCKISPTDESLRQDLEFYIPQLCNIILFGFSDYTEAIVQEVLNICSKSFFFSHRILWYLYSTDFELIEEPSIIPSELISQIIQASSHYSFFHLGSGEKLFNLYNSLKIPPAILSNYQSIAKEELLSAVETINAYTSGVYKSENYDEIEAKYIPLSCFMNYKSFFSTLKFIEALTKISENLISQTNKTEYLVEQLKFINTMLPAEVYIPFDTFRSRQCAVLHIPISEARVFTTKERAPYKICVEIFRPYKEIKYETSHEKKEKTVVPRANSLPVIKPKNSFESILTASITNSVMSDKETSTNLFDETHLIRRNLTFAAPSDIDASHYANFLTRDLQGVSAVYGEVDEAGKNVSVFKDSFKQQEKRIKKQSPYGKFRTWGLMHLIVKSGDDLRQEQFAMQLISFCKHTFDEKELGIWVYNYHILATGIDCGVLECVPDAVSIDGLKKSLPADKSNLLDFFVLQFGQPKSKRFKLAKQSFMKSLAGYSLICYIFQIKDRHNGNILIDRNGHLIHIDFGFMISNSPGGNFNFEKAPFKLTEEFEQVMGGRRSKLFQEFRQLCVKGYCALKEKTEQIILIVEMMRNGTGKNLDCFIGQDNSISSLRERLEPSQKMTEKDCKEYINRLIDESLDNWSTKCYDRFQYCCQNIFY